MGKVDKLLEDISTLTGAEPTDFEMNILFASVVKRIREMEKELTRLRAKKARGKRDYFKVSI